MIDGMRRGRIAFDTLALLMKNADGLCVNEVYHTSQVAAYATCGQKFDFNMSLVASYELSDGLCGLSEIDISRHNKSSCSPDHL